MAMLGILSGKKLQEISVNWEHLEPTARKKKKISVLQPQGTKCWLTKWILPQLDQHNRSFVRL